MMQIQYTPTFLKAFQKLPAHIQDLAFEKIDIFKTSPSHPKLHTHKLRGKYNDCYAFSINYSYRIVFVYSETEKDEVIFVSVGSHDQAYK